ncbi:uncharacterized protein TNCV_712191 [Trichonephila clavipes]|nr:uncharacterized protein TNCV_712191 [Trichonephila clavipes]
MKFVVEYKKKASKRGTITPWYLPGHATGLPYATHLKKKCQVVTFQQDGVLYHYHNDVTSYLNVDVPVWIVMQWPTRTPDLSRLDFSVWSFVKIQVYSPPFPASIPELKSRICPAIN